MHRRLVLIGFLSAVGCTHIHSSSDSEPIDRRLPRSILPASGDGRDTKTTSKRVSDKEAPGDLIASDASRCSVGETDWRLAEVGKSFTCDWHKAEGKPGKTGKPVQ